MRVVCILLKDSKDLRFLAETCLRFTPQVAMGERWLFLEIGACRHLYTEENLLAELQTLLDEFHIAAKIEIANDLPTAVASAVFNVRRREFLPIEAIPYFFNPFQYESQFESMVAVFRNLGVTALKKLEHIPPHLLTSKFNKNLTVVLRQIQDARNIYWPRFVPEEKVTERYEFQETQAVFNLEPLSFVMKSLLDRIAARLWGRALLVSKLEIVLEQERYSTVKEPVRKQVVELAFPHSSTEGLLAILRERLERELMVKPLEANVTSCTIQILETAPGGYRQKDFFSQKEETQEAVQSLISRVKDKLGESRIFYAQPLESFFPEKSWKKSLEVVGGTSHDIAPRPLRVLKNPIKLGRVDNYFICDKRRWRAMEISGPERLSGDWWLKEEGRNYFTIKTDSGEELWVYSPDDKDEYFLHGIYD